MNAKPWNQLRIALWGARIFGVIAIANEILTVASEPPAVLVGVAMGGATFGALLFGIFASARNWVVLQKR